MIVRIEASAEDICCALHAYFLREWHVTEESSLSVQATGSSFLVTVDWQPSRHESDVRQSDA